MEITVEEYHDTCDDGCCETYGYYIFVDGNKIGSIEGDDVNWMAELLTHYFKCKAAGHDIARPWDLTRYLNKSQP